MGRTALCLPLALLFLASVISSNAQKTEVAGQGEESRVTVTAGAPLTVECRLRPEQRAEWRRDGEAPPPDLRAAPEAPAADARLAARLRAPHARAAHAGLYTCTRERDHRVRVVVMPASLAPLAGADAATEAAEAAARTPAPALGAPGPSDVGGLLYDVRGEIRLNCTVPNEAKLQYIWHKNGTDVGSIGTLKERYTLGSDGASFHIKQSVEDDYGNYSCALAGQPETNQTWAVRGRPYLKLPANSNVVEGQNLKIVCKVIGKPYPTVYWRYTNSTETNGTYYDVSAVLGSRAKLAESEQGVPDGVLVLGPAERGDAGSYSCNASDATLAASTVLRVKDMYAALWPFLGICAEVIVLCAIILVYEKRRTKPDLDDSDTDNHDQKKS